MRKDGSLFWVHGTLQAVRDRSGSVSMYVKVAQDLTRQRRAERNTSGLLENAPDGILAADMRGRIVLMNSKIEMMFGYRRDELTGQLVETLVPDGARAVHRTHRDRYRDDLTARDMSPSADQLGRRKDGSLFPIEVRLSTLETEDGVQRRELVDQVIDVAAVVTEVWQDYAENRRGRTIELRCPPLPAVHGNRRPIGHVVANLLENAVKYTRSRTVAQVEVGSLPQPDGQIAVFVRDNGVGFDMSHADRLFQVFQRLHRAEDYEGTGIGLALAARIVGRHGGRMWAEAAPDQGATFYFTLSAVQAE